MAAAGDGAIPRLALCYSTLHDAARRTPLLVALVRSGRWLPSPAHLGSLRLTYVTGRKRSEGSRYGCGYG